MTTLTTLRASVRLRLGVSASDPQLTDINLTEMLNASFIQAGNLRNWPWLQDERTFSTAAGTKDYAVDDTWRRTLLLSTEQGDIKFRTRTDLIRSQSQAGSPRAWTYARVNGVDYIRFYPTPTAVETVTEVFLIQHVPLVDGSDETAWPDWATDFPMLQAAQMAASKIQPELAGTVAQELGRAYEALKDEVMPVAAGVLPARRSGWWV